MNTTDDGAGCILVVEDEASIRDGLVRALRTTGIEVLVAGTLAEARALVAAARRPCDCILLDLHLPDGDGLDLLAELRDNPQSPPVIVATSFDDGERIIRAMRLGAYEYITKPFDLALLRKVVGDATRAHALARRAPPREAALDDELVGRGEAMRAVWKAIGRAAASSASVLITGPTGAGKEVVARAIHRHSARASGPFVAVNLAGLAPSLLESELFGHERGAFTGATHRREGRVEAAAGGTLFLDEIGDLPPEMQTKLLRLLQERSFERVGGNEPVRADVRFVAATLSAVRPGAEGTRLRADLYYRLAVLEIEVPPLSQRRDDLPALVRHGLERASARGISDEAQAALCARDWPGNVRELLHAVERAAALAGGEVIDVRHLSAPASNLETLSAVLAVQVGHRTMREVVALVERTMLASALAAAEGNRTSAARLLGIGRPLLYAKMREHGIVIPTAVEDDEEIP
jgi:DNA-binding NtrC family response regulator